MQETGWEITQPKLSRSLDAARTRGNSACFPFPRSQGLRPERPARGRQRQQKTRKVTFKSSRSGCRKNPERTRVRRGAEGRGQWVEWHATGRTIESWVDGDGSMPSRHQGAPSTSGDVPITLDAVVWSTDTEQLLQFELWRLLLFVVLSLSSTSSGSGRCLRFGSRMVTL